MPYIQVGTENSGLVEIFYEDHGSGTPVVLSHGYPLSGRAWEKQIPVLLAAGHRVITYDRRGFGGSGQPSGGYDYETFAADLNALMEHLDLRGAVLIGHSMGTGDVTRYLGRYGTSRVTKAVLVSPIPPFLLQAGDNPQGLPRHMFEGFAQAARADRYMWLKQFLENFYNRDVFGGTLVSDEVFAAPLAIANGSSPIADIECIFSWLTDFRDDLPRLDLPVLVIQGDQDRILPFDRTGQRLPGLLKDARLVVINSGPHAIAWTHADQVNAEILGFLT